MAFQMSITKPVPFQSTPLVYPQAYWVASFDKLDLVTLTAVVKFSAYADKATREAGNVQPVAYHSFTITGAAFTKWFSAAAITGANTNVYAQAYAMAKVTPDPAPRIAIPTKGAPAPTVFFANAVNA